MRVCNSKTIPKRRFRPRVGLCCPLSGARSRRRSAAQPRASRGLQRAEVDCAHRLLEWRYMPHDLPPWEAIYQQTRRWLSADVFEAMVHDLRILLRLSEDRASDPTTAILDSRTLRSTPESGSRGGYEGHKHKKGSKVHAGRWTLWDTCSPCRSLRPQSKSGLGWASWRKLCKRLQASR